MNHLLAISIGPVQEFIAAARRTRDLWFGSYLLSEISRAVAKSVEKQGGQLIFPASLDAENVANVILAELNADEPRGVAKKAKDAAKECWKTIAENAKREESEAICDEIWKDQVDDVIEFYAAWVSCSGEYRDDRDRVMRLLAGRKNCKDFEAAKGRAGVPKSSLDGQRESVLKKGNRDSWRSRLRLSDGEQLDVVGVTKRLGKKPGERHPSYPSVARVAAETWLRGVQKQGKLQPLLDACEKLVARGLHKVQEENYQYFPYEGTVIYKDRHADLIEELQLDDRDLDDVATALKALGGEPNPYLAVLVADGDSMGEAISRLESVERHRKFSQKLSEFAVNARSIVCKHNGVLIYAGGDDVLAFLPVHTCLACARQLHDEFGTKLKEFVNSEGKPPTLSVGIAIGHFMENLEDLREYGQKAEKDAKSIEGKDALAVHLHKRGGAPIRVRRSWSASFDEHLSRYAEWIRQDALPGKLPYDLRNLVELYKDWRLATPEQTSEAMRKDVVRVIRDKQPRAGKQYMKEIEGIVKELNTPADLEKFSQELLVARLIATALRQASVPVSETTSEAASCVTPS